MKNPFDKKKSRCTEDPGFCVTLFPLLRLREGMMMIAALFAALLAYVSGLEFQTDIARGIK